MNASNAKQRILHIAEIGLLIAVLSLAGCQAMGQKDISRQVPTGNRVDILSGGPHALSFQTSEVTAKYQYQRVGNQLKLWGTKSVAYDNIKSLVMRLYFLDDQGRVIKRQSFYSPGRQFERAFVTPAGTKSFAFGYVGETRQSRGEDGVTFFYTPFG
jgi:hypothetical protein